MLTAIGHKGEKINEQVEQEECIVDAAVRCAVCFRYSDCMLYGRNPPDHVCLLPDHGRDIAFWDRDPRFPAYLGTGSGCMLFACRDCPVLYHTGRQRMALFAACCDGRACRAGQGGYEI